MVCDKTLSYTVLAKFGVVVWDEKICIGGFYLTCFHPLYIEDSALELFDNLLLLIFLDHFFDWGLGVGQHDKFDKVNCASLVFEMVVSQVHFEGEQGLCPIRGRTLFDTHGERLLVEIDEFSGISHFELRSNAVELIVKHSTELIGKCIASNEPEFQAGRW